MTAYPGHGGFPRPAGRRGREARGWFAGTSYSDVGITGITPIPGLFRYSFPCPRDGPVTWDDVLSRRSPAGIIRCVICAHEVSFLTVSARVIVPPCSSERRGSPRGEGAAPRGRWGPGWLTPSSAWCMTAALPARAPLAVATAWRRGERCA